MISSNSQFENESEAKACSNCDANPESHSDSSSKVLFALVAFIVASNILFQLINLCFINYCYSDNLSYDKYESYFKISNACHMIIQSLALFAIPYAIKNKNLKLIANILLGIHLIKNMITVCGLFTYVN